MNKKNHRPVKFYSQYDLANAWIATEAIIMLDNFNEHNNYNLNEICALYNCLKFIGFLKDEKKAEYEKLRQPINASIGKFWAKLKDEEFIERVSNLNREYHNDLIEMLVKYRIIEKFDAEVIFDGLFEAKVWLSEILKNEKFSRRFKEKIKTMILSDSANAELIISKYVACDNFAKKIYIPDNITKEEKEKLIDEYLDSDKANPNYVGLLQYPNAELKLSNKTRLKAKKNIEKFNADFFRNSKNGIQKISVAVKIDEKQKDPVIEAGRNGLEESYSFSKTFFDESLNRTRIIQNFADILGFIKYGGLLYLPSHKSEIGTFESLVGVHGEKEYPQGMLYAKKSMEIFAKTKTYIDFLKTRNVDIEKIISWSVSEYLKKEYGVDGIIFEPSTSQSLYEKTRSVLLELDSIKSRFNLYVENGEIDEELYELNTNAPNYNELKSTIPEKYLEVNSKNSQIKQIVYLLFSDQSHLNYINSKLNDINLFWLIFNNKISKQDFKQHQIQQLEFLTKSGVLILDGDMLTLSPEAKLLYPIYTDGAIIYHIGSSKERESLNKMKQSEWLIPSNTLLSSDETDWFDYMLDGKKFNNGPQLRNRYAHAIHPKCIAERDVEIDYIWAIIIAISLVIKIIGDFEIRKNLQPKE